ncbi:MAG TPA: hypothetical protein VIP56_05900 [Nitrososphaeraceae archaeon]
MKASSGSRMIAEEENKRVKTINPATEDILNEYDITSKEQISNVIKKRRMLLNDGRKISIEGLILFMTLQMN